MTNTTDSLASWIRIPEAVRLTGLSRTKLYQLLGQNQIRNASLKAPGQHHATRLIDRADLLAFIDRHATGGMNPETKE
jgi:hypothetical protein